MIAYPKFFVSIFTRSFIGEGKEINKIVYEIQSEHIQEIDWMI